MTLDQRQFDAEIKATMVTLKRDEVVYFVKMAHAIAVSGATVAAAKDYAEPFRTCSTKRARQIDAVMTAIVAKVSR